MVIDLIGIVLLGICFDYVMDAAFCDPSHPYMRGFCNARDW